ncbi:MAG: DUF192 domain-containing protein [Nanoarchaeota archaeon]
MSHKKISLLLIFALIFIGFGFIIFHFSNSIIDSFTKNQTTDNVKVVCFKQACFSVEIVRTAVERQRGLMFRESLDNDSGMLFIFDESGKQGFWMKNTLLPLDIIWIDENKTIVYLKENVLPCENNSKTCPIYFPNKDALYVLEINSGEVKKNNLSGGDIGVFN